MWVGGAEKDLGLTAAAVAAGISELMAMGATDGDAGLDVKNQ